jgi:hypothetical protein
MSGPDAPGSPIFEYNADRSYTENQGSEVLTPSTGGPPTYGVYSTNADRDARYRTPRRYVENTGSGSTYIAYGNAMAKPASFTGFLVVSSDAANDYPMGCYDNSATNATGWHIGRRTPSSETDFLISDGTDGTFVRTTDFTWVSGTLYVMSFQYTAGQTTGGIWVNGVSRAVTSVAIGGASMSDSNSGTAQTFTLLRSGAYTGTGAFDGRVYRMTIFNSVLSDAVRSDYESALMAYYL